MVSTKYTLTQYERDIIFAELNGNQRKYIHEQLREAKQRAFAMKLEKWHLIDFLDAGPFWKRNPWFCECGKPIRYQYIIRNNVTGKVKKLGMSHLQEHTGVTLHKAKEIRKAIKEIYEELDELLWKYNSGWSLEVEGIMNFPTGMEIPDYIQETLNLGFPLSYVQVILLRIMIYHYYKDRIRRFKKEERLKNVY